MKTRKLYDIRIDEGNTSPRSIGRRFRPYNRARKLAGYLRRRYGLDTVLSPWNVNAASSDNRGNSFTGAAYAAL